jgi:hypothetical protein
MARGESSAKAGYGGTRRRVKRGEIHHLRTTMFLLSSGCCNVWEKFFVWELTFAKERGKDRTNE